MRDQLRQATIARTAATVMAIASEPPGPSMTAAAGGYELEWVRSAADALAALVRGSITHVAFLLVHPAAAEDEGIREIRRRFPRLPVVTSLPDGDPGPERESEAPARDTGDGHPAFYTGGGWSKGIRTLLAQVAAGDAPVLLQGETGSGKEVVARFLHAHSPRAHLPLLKVNCAALPSELVESELFGYERGAFTGAFARKPGKFELADGGGILLDEIGDMEFRLQGKLLQVLQDRSFDRLGGKQVQQVDVRVLAATHCDLEAAVREGRFRQDLYYRLNVITIRVPALRDRRDEILPLCEFFLRKHAAPGAAPPVLPESLKAALTAYDWPGNVRELENMIRRLLILRDPEFVERELRLHQLAARPAAALAAPSEEALSPVQVGAVLEHLEEANRRAAADAILAALNAARWNRKQAAARLGIGYKALLYRMRKLGIDGDGPAGSASSPARERIPSAEDNFPTLGNSSEQVEPAAAPRKDVLSFGPAKLGALRVVTPRKRPESCTPKRVPNGTERA